MKKQTSDLLKELKNAPSLDSYLKSNQNELFFDSVADMIEYYLITKKLEKSDVIRRSNLQRNYAYQIISGSKKNPSRDKLLMICFGMQLDLEDTNRLLKMGGYPELYPRDMRDSTIIYCILHGCSIIDTNLLLNEKNLKTLD